jgi:hypothetical protein
VSATAGLSLRDTDDEPSGSLEPAAQEEVG